MAGPHQINPNRLTRTDQIAQRLLLIARHPDRMKLPRQQQPGEQLGVTTIGLHAVPRRPGDLARRRHDTLNATPSELSREPVPGRACLIRDPHRAGQPDTEPGRRSTSPPIANDRNSPLSASSTAATIFVACTSKPTRF